MASLRHRVDLCTEESGRAPCAQALDPLVPGKSPSIHRHLPYLWMLLAGTSQDQGFLLGPRVPSWILLVWMWQAPPPIQPACPSLYKVIKRNNTLGKTREPRWVCSSLEKVTCWRYFYFPVPNAIFFFVGELVLRTEPALSGEKQRPFFLVVLSLQDTAQTQAASSLSLSHQKEICLPSVLSFLTVCPRLTKWQASVTVFIKHKGVAVSILAVFIQNHEVRK